MNVFETIEKIRLDNDLGVVEFLELTGISSGAYYAMQKGITKKLNTKTINKIVGAFPNYSIEDFSNLKNLSNNSSKDYQQQLEKIPVAEIMIYLSKYRKEKFEPDPLYQALKQLIEAEYEKSTFQEKYEDLLSKLSPRN